jgi:hypothetical protein
VGKAQVEPVVQQLGDLHARVELAQRDAHRRVLGLERAQRLRQAAVQHGADEADAQPPRRASATSRASMAASSACST